MYFYLLWSIVLNHRYQACQNIKLNKDIGNRSTDTLVDLFCEAVWQYRSSHTTLILFLGIYSKGIIQSWEISVDIKVFTKALL